MNPIASTAPSGITPLQHLGVIRLRGQDAAKFIHSQVSQDFVLLDMQHARLAAYCTAKGRMLASFIGVKRSEEEILLLCSADMVAATLKRLSMFVLRAKVQLDDASALFSLWGLCGSATLGLDHANSNSAAIFQPWIQPWSVQTVQGASIITLYPADGVARQLWLAPSDHASPSGVPLRADQWAWTEVRSAIATLTQPLVEAFVPQMLNYESVGGVNFQKGCYPGQEVVARSQFRGSIKRRTFLTHCNADLTAGDSIFCADSATEPIGVVVQAAPHPVQGWDALVCLQLSALAHTPLSVASATGAHLEVLELPYQLMEDL